MEILFLLIGIVLGAIVAYLFVHYRNVSLLKSLELECNQYKVEKAQLSEEAEHRLRDQELSYQKLMEVERKNALERLELEKQNTQQRLTDANNLLEKERQHSQQLREENEKEWNAKFETLKQEIFNLATKQLLAKQTDLQNTNRTQFDELMRPIKEQFLLFQKTIEESKKQNELNTHSVKDSFEHQMKLFAQQQNMVVSSLKEQTEKIGSDAANLTKALKGDSKIQGDWGEMILENILENSGLRKGEEYLIQETIKGEEGKNFRPDVIVKFPENRSVIIDSKVSLSAYSQALETEDEQQKKELLKQHVNSVWNHVEELASKNYSQIVPNSVGYVLMFIPNESSYIAALKQRPNIGLEAYQKHIVIISSSNLMMALQLAYNLWQTDRQSKNIENIIHKASELYDKIVGFQDDFLSIERSIDNLNKSFGSAKNKLYEGNGNIMRRAETLKKLGISPKKSLCLE